MQHLRRIDQGIDVAPVLEQLAAHPELWDQQTIRKTQPGSPHVQMSDIWVRYRPFDELTGPEAYREKHGFAWYPAWTALPGLDAIVARMLDNAGPSVDLGGIMITRIPPGGEILPHHDRGTWHAEHFNHKVYVPLAANPYCINRCEGEAVVMKVGEAWTFDNLVVHSVENMGTTERMTLIICMRVER